MSRVRDQISRAALITTASLRLRGGFALRSLDDLDFEPAHVAQFFGFFLGSLVRISSQHDQRGAVAGKNLEIWFGPHLHLHTYEAGFPQYYGVICDDLPQGMTRRALLQ